MEITLPPIFFVYKLSTYLNLISNLFSPLDINIMILLREYRWMNKKHHFIASLQLSLGCVNKLVAFLYWWYTNFPYSYLEYIYYLIFKRMSKKIYNIPLFYIIPNRCLIFLLVRFRHNWTIDGEETFFMLFCMYSQGRR